jgi:hypothetical protein
MHSMPFMLAWPDEAAENTSPGETNCVLDGQRHLVYPIHLAMERGYVATASSVSLQSVSAAQFASAHDHYYQPCLLALSLAVVLIALVGTHAITACVVN